MAPFNFKPVPTEIVTSAATGKTTVRSTDAGAPYNSNLLKRLQAIAEYISSDNLFNEEIISSNVELVDLQRLLTQVIIRFDNDPNYYTKRDYQYLIWYLCKSLIYTSTEIPGLAELQEAIEYLTSGLEAKLDKTDDQLLTEDQTIVGAINGLFEQVNKLERVVEDISTGLTKIEQLQKTILEQERAISNLRQSVDLLGTMVIDDYQTKYDDSLETDNKTIVAAINELKASIGAGCVWEGSLI